MPWWLHSYTDHDCSLWKSTTSQKAKVEEGGEERCYVDERGVCMRGWRVNERYLTLLSLKLQTVDMQRGEYELRELKSRGRL